MSRAALAYDVKPAERSKAKIGPSTVHVNKPADAHDRETDSIAEHAGPGAGHKPLWSLSKVRMGSSADNESPGPAKPGNVPPIVHNTLGSPGRPLDSGARGFFEQRFGRNFSQVRIHTGEDAAQAASSLHSSAFTLGNDIVFARDRYAPSTPKGRTLLAHELRHVQQQRYAVRSPEPAVDLPTSSHEVQARSIFDTDIQPISSQRIQCAPEGDQFALDGDVINSVGRVAFGDTAWAFLKAVIEGFVNGLKSDLQAGRGEEAKSHLHGLFVPWNAGKFYLGYLVGLVLGLISPVTDLVKGIIGIIKLAGSALEWLAKWSPVGVAISPERQQKIAIIRQRFSDLAVQFGNAIVEFAKDPKGSAKKFSDFLDSMMNLALGQARTMGANAAHSIFDFLKEDYYDMGESIGKVIGGLIAQVLLLVFSDAIGNLISEAASMIGKAAEFVAGKAVELIEWVASFASKVISKVREAINGALKLFKGLANSLIDAFDALKALFTESEELAGGLKAAPAGGGELGAVPKAPNVMESRMVTSTRTSPAKVEDLKPPKIHPSKTGEVTPPKTATTKVSEPPPKELAKPKVGGAEVDKPLTETEGGLKPKQQKPAPSGTSPADKGVAPGLTRDEAAAAKTVIGDMKSGDGTLAKIWEDVANPGEKAKLTKSNSRRLFNNQRKRFWNAVFDDPKAKKMFEKMGAKFPKRGNAPVLKLPSGEELQMTIDHVIERQTNPSKALDATNLRISPRRENTVVLRQLHDQDPFQNPAQHGWQPFP